MLIDKNEQEEKIISVSLPPLLCRCPYEPHSQPKALLVQNSLCRVNFKGMSDPACTDNSLPKHFAKDTIPLISISVRCIPFRLS